MNLDNSSSIVLDTDNTHLFNSSRRLIFSSNFWHEFRISNCKGIPRNVVLKAVLDAAYPFDLQPLNFNVQNENYHFLSNNCGAAIEKLCQQNLIVNNPRDDQNPFKVAIALNYARACDLKINILGNLSQVWRKRYNGLTKTLNLDEFHEDSDLQEYCPLSQSRILDYILQLGRNFVVQHLQLSNNDIRTFKFVKPYNISCQLYSLDLKNNLISSVDELKLFSSPSVRSVWLEGNPICDDYDEHSYVCAIREIFPKVEKLDGVLIYEYGLPTFCSNYVCDVQGRELVDQFLEHYFTLYDSDNRSLLSDIYHADAVFSCTCRYIEGQLSSSSANLAEYKNYARNIRTLSDFARSDEKLYKGKRRIINVLCDLPPTEHDPNTFCVDLTYYTEHSAVITVTGVFREPEVNLEFKQPVLGFSRIFVLISSGDDEYKIINDQLHVSNATTAQQIRAFRIERTPDICKLHKPVTDAERNDVIQAFESITTLNSDWSKMYLEKCSYNLKDALLFFVNLYKADAIPKEAFVRSNEAVLNSNETIQNSNQTFCWIESAENNYNFNSGLYPSPDELAVHYQQWTSENSKRTPSLITVNVDDSPCKRTEEEDFQERVRKAKAAFEAFLKTIESSKSKHKKFKKKKGRGKTRRSLKKNPPRRIRLLLKQQKLAETDAPNVSNVLSSELLFADNNNNFDFQGENCGENSSTNRANNGENRCKTPVQSDITQDSLKTDNHFVNDNLTGITFFQDSLRANNNSVRENLSVSSVADNKNLTNNQNEGKRSLSLENSDKNVDGTLEESQNTASNLTESVEWQDVYLDLNNEGHASSSEETSDDLVIVENPNTFSSNNKNIKKENSNATTIKLNLITKKNQMQQITETSETNATPTQETAKESNNPVPIKLNLLTKHNNIRQLEKVDTITRGRKDKLIGI